MCINHHSGKTSIDFVVKRSKVMVVYIYPQLCFWNENSCFDKSIVFTPHTHIINHPEKSLLILGSKGQQSSSHQPTNSFHGDNSCLDLSIIFRLNVYITHHSGTTRIDFGFKRLEVKVTDQDF